MVANDSRYFNLTKVARANVPFNFIIGGRGTGKTYRCLWNAYDTVSPDTRFMYLRRTEVEISSIADAKYNPFKAINRKLGYNVQARYIAKNSVGEFYETVESEEERFLGYAAALSTFGKLRGADLSDTDKVIFDEFIKPSAARHLKDEADLFFNAYETINRNREIEGKPPVMCYLLSNATSLNNPILAELGLTRIIENMKRNGDTVYTDRQRGAHIELLDNIAISKEKADTALYKLTKSTTYAAHALDNEFAYDSFENIEKVSLNEYTPWIQLSDMYIYKHKSRLEFYVSATSKAKCKFVFTGDKEPLFKRQYGYRFHHLIMGGYVLFQSFAVKQKLLSYFE